MLTVLITAVLALFYLGCDDDNIVDPEEELINPRDMVWRADTIGLPDDGTIQMLPEDLLVISPEEIFLAVWVGHGQIWHYDGSSWSLNEDTGGTINALIESRDRIYAAGNTGKHVYILQYDGNSWFDIYPGFYTVEPSEWLEGDILDMSVDDSGNILACGRDGLVMKSTDSTWIVDTVGIVNMEKTSEYFFKDIEFHDGKIYLLVTSTRKITLQPVYYYLAVDKDFREITQIDSNISGADPIGWGYNGLYAGGDVLYSYGSGLWEYSGNGWQYLLAPGTQIEGFYSISENYMIAVGTRNKVMFYDGNSWEPISDIFEMTDPTFWFENVWTNGKHTVITGWGEVDGETKLMVWHGSKGE